MSEIQGAAAQGLEAQAPAGGSAGRRLNPSLLLGGGLVAVVVVLALVSYVWTP